MRAEQEPRNVNANAAAASDVADTVALSLSLPFRFLFFLCPNLTCVLVGLAGAAAGNSVYGHPWREGGTARGRSAQGHDQAYPGGEWKHHHPLSNT